MDRHEIWAMAVMVVGISFALAWATINETPKSSAQTCAERYAQTEFCLRLLDKLKPADILEVQPKQ